MINLKGIDRVETIRKEFPYEYNKIYEQGKKDSENKQMFELIKDKVSMPYKEWEKKYPYFSKWLKDNGFVYFEENDLGQKELMKE